MIELYTLNNSGNSNVPGNVAQSILYLLICYSYEVKVICLIIKTAALNHENRTIENLTHTHNFKRSQMEM